MQSFVSFVYAESLSQNHIADDVGESSDQISQQNFFVDSVEDLTIQVAQAEFRTDEIEKESNDSAGWAALRWTSLLLESSELSWRLSQAADDF